MDENNEAKKAKKTVKKGKSTLRNIIIVILVLAALGSAGAYFGMDYFNNPKPIDESKRTVTMPAVSTPILSSSTGETYYILVSMSLVFEKPSTDDYTYLKQIVADAVAGLDYDRATGNNSVSYVKEHVKSEIDPLLADNVIEKIIITDLINANDPIRSH